MNSTGVRGPPVRKPAVLARTARAREPAPFLYRQMSARRALGRRFRRSLVMYLCVQKWKQRGLTLSFNKEVLLTQVSDIVVASRFSEDFQYNPFLYPVSSLLL